MSRLTANHNAPLGRIAFIGHAMPVVIKSATDKRLCMAYEVDFALMAFLCPNARCTTQCTVDTHATRKTYVAHISEWNNAAMSTAVNALQSYLLPVEAQSVPNQWSTTRRAACKSPSSSAWPVASLAQLLLVGMADFARLSAVGSHVPCNKAQHHHNEETRKKEGAHQMHLD